MSSKIDLTIAIPTYNRSRKLGKTLDSVIGQIDKNNHNIEVVISDNCSTDDTELIVEKYVEKYPYIKYSKNSENKGIDYNIYKCTELASGEYVQLLSDDDILMEGSLSYILRLIEENRDISFFYLNGRGFELDGEEKNIFQKNSVINKTENIFFMDKNEFIEFLGVQITFVSAFLLHRETWNKNQDKDRFIGTDIYLSYDLIHLLANSNKYMFVAKDLIGVYKDYTPGNYRIFYAFAFQWNKLLLKEAVLCGFRADVMERIFKNSIKNDLKNRILAIRFNPSSNTKIGMRELKWIISSTYNFAVSYIDIYPVLFLPKFFVKVLLFIERKYRNFQESKH